jgi:hypothetical protein
MFFSVPRRRQGSPCASALAVEWVVPTAFPSAAHGPSCRAFGLDMLTRPDCGGRRRPVAPITDHQRIEEILV